MFYGIVITAIAGIVVGLIDMPDRVVSTVPSLAPTFGQAFMNLPELFTAQMAIVVFTIRGNMARHTAWMRPRYSAIYAVCENWAVANALALNWGVTPVVIPFNHPDPEKTIEPAVQLLIRKGLLKKQNTAVIISSISVGEQIVDAVQMRVV